MKILSVVNQKGGVGKTTLVFNLAHLLCDEGFKVLAVDLDPQANLTLSTIGEVPEEDLTSYHLLLNGELPIRETESFDLIPSSLILANAELELVSSLGRELRLLKALSKLGDRYDLSIIDTPPNLGILTINALMASDGVLIPTETKPYGLAGLKHLIKVFPELKEFADKDLSILGIVPTLFERTVILQKEALEELRHLPY